mmetsp:Transcript_20964/g.48444  ORF Transcript_20964/g.48444 Transcript_20964/m.48444 type:complete len:627 (-) Transcript_20964:47-1927(-)
MGVRDGIFLLQPLSPPLSSLLTPNSTTQAQILDAHSSHLEVSIWDTKSRCKGQQSSAGFMGECLLNLSKLVPFQGHVIEQEFTLKRCAKLFLQDPLRVELCKAQVPAVGKMIIELEFTALDTQSPPASKVPSYPKLPISPSPPLPPSRPPPASKVPSYPNLPIKPSPPLTPPVPHHLAQQQYTQVPSPQPAPAASSPESSLPRPPLPPPMPHHVAQQEQMQPLPPPPPAPAASSQASSMPHPPPLPATSSFPLPAPMEPQVTTQCSNTDTGGCSATGKYVYTATSPDELSIKVGDKFIILGKADDEGWFVALDSLSGRQGLVPSTHIREDTHGQVAAVASAAHPGAAARDESKATARSDHLHNELLLTISDGEKQGSENAKDKREGGVAVPAEKGELGLTLNTDEENNYVVTHVVYGGPAFRDGRVQPGDILLEIDGVHMDSLSQEEIRRFPQAPVGESILLKFSTKGDTWSVRLKTEPQWQERDLLEREELEDEQARKKQDKEKERKRQKNMEREKKKREEEEQDRKEKERKQREERKRREERERREHIDWVYRREAKLDAARSTTGALGRITSGTKLVMNTTLVAPSIGAVSLLWSVWNIWLHTHAILPAVPKLGARHQRKNRI